MSIYFSIVDGEDTIVIPGSTGRGWKMRDAGSSSVEYIFEDPEVVEAMTKRKKDMKPVKCGCKKSDCTKGRCLCLNAHIDCKLAKCKCGPNCANPHRDGGFCEDVKCTARRSGPNEEAATERLSAPVDSDGDTDSEDDYADTGDMIDDDVLLNSSDLSALIGRPMDDVSEWLDDLMGCSPHQEWYDMAE